MKWSRTKEMLRRVDSLAKGLQGKSMTEQSRERLGADSRELARVR